MNRILSRGRFGILFIAMAMACTTMAPPRDLIERNDHTALTAWYANEAVRLRDKADEMRRMVEVYAEPTYHLSPKESREELILHCQLFIEYYSKAAVEADALAHLHHEAATAIP